MEKLNLKFQGTKEMLTREQMKNITGGYGSCNVTGWTAHSSDWYYYTDNLENEDQAIMTMLYYGWSNYCNDSCHTSCCTTQPTFSGC